MDINKIQLNSTSIDDMKWFKWFPLNSGGGYRKWFGLNKVVINLENNAEDIKNSKTNYRLRSTDFYFRPGITWGRITSGGSSFRKSRIGNLFGDAGPMLFLNDSNSLNYVLSFLNSKVLPELERILNPTLNFQVNDLAEIPIKGEETNKVEVLADKNIKISQKDDSLDETSFDFLHSFIKPALSFKQAYTSWSNEALTRFNQLKSNEEELNRIFIDLYGLQDELIPEEDDKEVSVRKADPVRDIKAFLSYFIGCVFGR